MKWARLSALGSAVVSVGLLATPASAAKTSTTIRGKDAHLVVTDCPASGPAGTKCLAWDLFAGQQRVKTDGTVTKTASVILVKIRVTLTSTAPGFKTKTVATYSTDAVQLNVGDDLASASGRAVIPLRGDDLDVSFALAANAPAVPSQSRSVLPGDDCRVVFRFNGSSRTADGTATIEGKTYSTVGATAVGFPSTIDQTAQTIITKGQCPAPAAP